MFSDINELKVFVDLASIYAGENDMEVDRVACFHDAVLGYSSMLYGLKQDSDFDTFSESLLKLWRALENDKEIPKKLVSHSNSVESILDHVCFIYVTVFFFQRIRKSSLIH